MKFIEQEISPKTFRGVGYAADARVLVRKDGVGILVWRKGGTDYVDRSRGNKYSPASLQFIAESRYTSLAKEIHEGGRLSMDLIFRNSEEIDRLFGKHVAMRISLKHTLVVEKGE